MREPDMDTLVFFSGHPDALELYRVFEDLLYREFPCVNRRVQKTQITFYNRHVFACVSFARVKKKAELPEGYLVITIGLPAPLESPRIAVKKRTVSQPVDASYCHQPAGGTGRGTDGLDPGIL